MILSFYLSFKLFYDDNTGDAFVAELLVSLWALLRKPVAWLILNYSTSDDETKTSEFDNWFVFLLQQRLNSCALLPEVWVPYCDTLYVTVLSIIICS